jgi:hypothetical protein
MDDLKAALATLEPPIQHTVEYRDRVMYLVLIDAEINATVERVIPAWQYQNRDLLHVIILHAIHELQLKGSHAPLRKLPLVGGRLLQAEDF